MPARQLVHHTTCPLIHSFSYFFTLNFSFLIFPCIFAAAKVRRDGRVVDCIGLENRRTERYRGFESLSLRKKEQPYGCSFCVRRVLTPGRGFLRSSRCSGGKAGANPSLSARKSNLMAALFVSGGFCTAKNVCGSTFLRSTFLRLLSHNSQNICIFVALQVNAHG